MHQILTVQEFLTATFAIATLERADVLACALVCVAWLEPALDQLYREACYVKQEDNLRKSPVCITAFFHCWPVDLLDYSTPSSDSDEKKIRVYRLLRDIREGDWVRFDFYAKHVRKLGLWPRTSNSKADFDVSPNFYTTLLAYFDSQRSSS
ncbi:hypothetical protein FRB98_003745, partial [Tulasnella sp. 332]